MSSSASTARWWPRALVFDLDGTIVDTEVPSFEAWRRIWADRGQTLDLADWVLCVGRSWDLFDPLAALDDLLGGGLDREAVRAEKRALEHELVRTTVVRPGVVEWLDEAAAGGAAIGLASSSPRVWVDGHLERLGLRERFATVQTVTEVGVTKPDPASYLAACAALEVNPADALAIEDSVNGIDAAMAAGMRVVACPNPITAALDLSAADLVVDSLADLTLAAATARMARMAR